MPRAETGDDLQHQREIADFVVNKYPHRYDGCLFLSQYKYVVDGVFHKNRNNWYAEPVLFCEIKQRTCTFGQYPSGYLLAVNKVIAARHLLEATGLRTVLFVRFADGVIAAVDVQKHDGHFRIAGRTDRGLISDTEPEVTYPWNRFAILHDPRSG